MTMSSLSPEHADQAFERSDPGITWSGTRNAGGVHMPPHPRRAVDGVRAGDHVGW
jgi:hypothetical protein